MAAAKEGGETSGEAKKEETEPTLEELLHSLNLKGEDIDGLFVAKSEVETLKEEVKWMAVMRLLTTKPFSAISLKKTLKFAWAPAQEVSFRDLEGNRFLVQANCLGDWKRITEQGPWIFRDHGLLIEKYDGSCRATAVELNRIHAWVCIHDVPELYRKKQLISSLAERIGEVLLVDMNGVSFDGGDFVRVRVWLDVRKCLTRFVSFKPEGEKPVIMRVKYEKIPRYCAVCGLLGHEQEECGSGEHTLEAKVFGKWLLADTPWNRAQLHGGSAHRPAAMPDQGGQDARDPSRGRGTGRGFGRNGQAGRGRGSGSVMGENRKRNSAEARLESPAKDGTGKGAGVAPLLLQWKEPGVIEPSGGGGAKQKLDFPSSPEKAYEPRAGTPPPPPSAREQKRPKKHVTPKKDRNTLNASAAAGEGRLPQ
ncbi:hypothetical protein QYE76_018120 [Lolium multiflorum]|uniref:Zinc knuckle CX2CX4HX4C domain-containing protein n=1 Tax=Lolium multiflorum TaxID=4521 RepID=A0AAD8UXX1_LOLMU|nr:hypothetical protein QYE76_018196 [Lolium multiflorum]KAK1561650.1 hypothetical protein QYE76_000025 [Lolium multiflorum]KAK1603264.1 hypothetical protein QYE76_018120 [Lolium multiflorum]